MSVGLPGTGIGGIFYLLSALWMPFREIYLRLNKRSQPRRARFILLQFSIAVGILTTLWFTGWMLAELLLIVNERLGFEQMTAQMSGDALPNVIRVTFIFLTLGVLALVVSGVHILRLVVRYRKSRRDLGRRESSLRVSDVSFLFSEIQAPPDVVSNRNNLAYSEELEKKVR